MSRRRSSALILLCGLALMEASANADIPVGYKGLPFDPAVAGGAGVIPPTVKAGPYPIPGRLDFINYDLGGEMVAYHAGDHLTDNGTESLKLGLGYRTDKPTATLARTSQISNDIWYDTGTALDGTPFPSPTTYDFDIGAVQVDDWYNFTVDVQTAGTYWLSSTWGTGNGPPGGEGGDGAMGLEVFSNGTLLTSWSTTFPNYQTEANFHHWKPYPNFAMVTLAAGLQVVKLQSTTKHLNLDYVEFTLTPLDGGLDSLDMGTGPPGDASLNGAGGGSSSGSAAGSTGASGTSDASVEAAGASSGAVATTGGGSDTTASGVTGNSGAAASGTVVTTSGGVGNSGTPRANVGAGTGNDNAGATSGAGTVPAESSKGCALGAAPIPARGSAALLLVFGGVLRARRRKATARCA